MSTPKRVAVVGAGISGLAHAEVLTRCGFSVVVFESAPRLGGVWACSYPNVSLQNTGNEYRLSTFPWPFEPDQHPTGDQIRAYLEALVAARGFDVRLGHEVVSAREAPGGGWDVVVRSTRADERGDATNGEQPIAERFDHLVVSIGQYTEGKHRPALDGEAEFGGRVVTEREIGALSAFDGARVAVVGFGKSALDMASFAAKGAKQVHHIFRTPRWTLPRYIFGIHYVKLFFNRFGSVMMTCWSHPTAIERFLHRRRGVVAGFWSMLERVLSRIARRPGRRADAAGRARLDTVMPEHGLLPDLRSAAALAPPDYYAQVARGAIEPHRGEVAGLCREGVRLSDGSVVPADLVVLSVGSRPPRFPFLDDATRTLLESEEDGAQLFRHVVHPRLPRLGFAGFNHGFLHVPAAEVGALWLAALWQGRIALPSVEAMERDVEHVRAWKRANIHFEPSRSCAVNTRFQQYLDIMLADLGLSPYRKLPNVFAEIFATYGPADYADLVEELHARPAGPPRQLVPLPN